MEQWLAKGRLDNDPKLTLGEFVAHSQHSNHGFLHDGLGSCIEKRQSCMESAPQTERWLNRWRAGSGRAA